MPRKQSKQSAAAAASIPVPAMASASASASASPAKSKAPVRVPVSSLSSSVGPAAVPVVPVVPVPAPVRVFAPPRAPVRVPAAPLLPPPAPILQPIIPPRTTLIPISLRPGFTAPNSTTFTNDINMTGTLYGTAGDIGFLPKSSYAAYQTPFNVLDKVSSVVKAEITKELYEMLAIFGSYSLGSMSEAGARGEYESYKKKIKGLLVAVKQNDKLRPQEKVSLLYQIIAELDNIMSKLDKTSTFDISKTTDRNSIMNRNMYMKMPNPPSIKKQLLFLKIVKTWALEELAQLH